MSRLRRLARWLLRRRPGGTEMCEVCGERISKGWAIHERIAVIYDAGVANRDGGMSAFYCRQHRPVDGRAVPWSA